MLAFVFPGQGSQSPGMGKFLYDNFSMAKPFFEEASDAIGVDLKQLCFSGSPADLALTENTQPCLVLVSVATAKVLEQEFGMYPQAVAGHSVGEYSAFVVAGAMSFAPAIRAVRARGLAMQSAVPVGQGGMAAVLGMANSDVEQLCEKVVSLSGYGPLTAANFNCPGQVVVSGSAKSVDWLIQQAKPGDLFPEDPSKTWKALPLKVSAPFHCALMGPAEKHMQDVLEKSEITDSRIPIYQNLDARPHTRRAELLSNLIKQITGSVRWQQSIEKMRDDGFTELVECGTGKVLHGLVKKIDSATVKVFNTTSLEELKQTAELCRKST